MSNLTPEQAWERAMPNTSVEDFLAFEFGASIEDAVKELVNNLPNLRPELFAGANKDKTKKLYAKYIMMYIEERI